MKDKVIRTARLLWLLLGEKGEVKTTQLPKWIDEKNEVVFQALGWLAREDKIQYRTDKRSTLVSLVPSEKHIYDSIISASEEALTAIA